MKYNVEDFYSDEGRWQALARNKYFESVMLGIIGLNSIWIWVDTDYNDAETLVDAHWAFQVGENMFCLCFSFEWLVRFMAFKRKLNSLKDSWFVFDSLLVLMMVVETWIVTAYLALSRGPSDSKLGAASILRLFRLLRLTRMVRMLRSFTELMILVKGMLSAMRSVTTVILLLFIVMYVFGIAMTQLAAGSGSEEKYFSNVGHSMYTLLVYGVFLDSIARLCNDVRKDGDFYSGTLVCLLFSFILIATLTVLNMLIGVLCEVVSRVAEKERNDIEVASVTQKLREAVELIDEDGNMRISQTEFAQLLSNRGAVMALKAAEVDPEELVDNMAYIFAKAEALDGEYEPALHFQDFMEVLLELRGTNIAKVRDVIKFQKSIAAQFQQAKLSLLPSTKMRAHWKNLAAVRRGSVVPESCKSGIVSKVDSGESRVSHAESNTEDLPRAPPAAAHAPAPAPAGDASALREAADGSASWPVERRRQPSAVERGAALVAGSRRPSALAWEVAADGAAAASAAACGDAVRTLARRAPRAPGGLRQLQERTARLEGMLDQIVREVQLVSARAEAQQRARPRDLVRVPDSTGGIDWPQGWPPARVASTRDEQHLTVKSQMLRETDPAMSAECLGMDKVTSVTQTSWLRGPSRPAAEGSGSENPDYVRPGVGPESSRPAEQASGRPHSHVASSRTLVTILTRYAAGESKWPIADDEAYGFRGDFHGEIRSYGFDNGGEYIDGDYGPSEYGSHECNTDKHALRFVDVAAAFPSLSR
ncbi:unnamed protein product [Prorocentrum cordatum]|uniref:EF-hand domain-containing protein n=1 Tax=Prorocentrum cordatum TaxID=2364126 RepID=A0ABN9U8R5_9DINO|nr:unnamed protein product [Polarella glacialis]